MPCARKEPPQRNTSRNKAEQYRVIVPIVILLFRAEHARYRKKADFSKQNARSARRDSGALWQARGNEIILGPGWEPGSSAAAAAAASSRGWNKVIVAITAARSACKSSPRRRENPLNYAARARARPRINLYVLIALVNCCVERGLAMEPNSRM